MSSRLRIHQAVRIYSDKGLLTLLIMSLKFLRNKALARYRTTIEYVLGKTSEQCREISLSGVTVPVPVYPIGDWIPFYTHPHPVADDPNYEATEIAAIREYAAEGDDVVIVGAGLGVTTVVAAKVTAGDVIAYEQSGDACDILRDTLRANDVSEQVTVQQAAVGENAEAQFTHHLEDTAIVDPVDLPNADVYEMDCEGAELHILKQMCAQPRTLLVETHYNHDDVVEQLEQMGYELIDIADQEYFGCSHIRAEHGE